MGFTRTTPPQPLLLLCVMSSWDLAAACEDNNAGAVEAAAGVGVTVEGCSDIITNLAPCDDEAYGADIRRLCPLTCDACPSVGHPLGLACDDAGENCVGSHADDALGIHAESGGVLDPTHGTANNGGRESTSSTSENPGK